MEKEIAVKVKESKAVFRWLSFIAGLVFCLVGYSIFQQYNLWHLEKQQVAQQELLFRTEESLRDLSTNIAKQSQLFLKLSEEVEQRVVLIEKNIAKQEKDIVPIVLHEEEINARKAKEELKVAIWQRLDGVIKIIDQHLTVKTFMQPEQFTIITKTPENLDWREQLKETLKRISRLIQIREYKSPNHYLSLDAKESLRIETKLHLEQAKIALVSGEVNLFQVILNRAIENMQALGLDNTELKDIKIGSPV
jgi:hypothetical protein